LLILIDIHAILSVFASQTAQIILKGVRKNKALIVFPFSTRFFCWLYRLHPAFLAPIQRKIIGDFRLLRKVSDI
jgi:hypothetical protein